MHHPPPALAKQPCWLPLGWGEEGEEGEGKVGGWWGGGGGTSEKGRLCDQMRGGQERTAKITGGATMNTARSRAGCCSQSVNGLQGTTRTPNSGRETERQRDRQDTHLASKPPVARTSAAVCRTAVVRRGSTKPSSTTHCRMVHMWAWEGVGPGERAMHSRGAPPAPRGGARPSPSVNITADSKF